MTLLDSITPPGYLLEFLFKAFILFKIIQFLYFLYKCLLRKRKDLVARYGKDSYVLITGATEGIGRSFATSFARLGFNLILVSRNQSKLEKARSELHSEFSKSIKIEIIPFDFEAKNTVRHYDQTFKELTSKFDVSVLVNNVGYSLEKRLRCTEELGEIIKHVNINILPQALLSKMFSDRLESRAHRSAIISLSSINGIDPYPNNSLYAACKAFNDFLSIGMFGEYGYEKSNIDFLTVRPFYVESNMSKMKADFYNVISAQQCTESVLNDLGYELTTFGHLSHKVQGYLLMRLPELVKRYIYEDARLQEEKIARERQEEELNRKDK